MKKWRQMTVFVLLCLTLLVSFQVQAEEMQNDKTAERIEKAKELSLESWIDEEGYLFDSFFEGKSDGEISEMSLDGLVRTLTDEEIDAYAEHLRSGMSPLIVSKYQKVSQVNPATGRLLYTGIFEVDGILAYCIERSEDTPAQGSPTGPWIAVTNDNIRKVLYYGYNGPADKGYTFVETALAAAEANGNGDNSLGRLKFAEIKGLEVPPENFYVWKVETNGGTTQDLAFYTLEVPKGKVQLKKNSANPEMTQNNENYSLAEAEYAVYEDIECTTEVGYLVTDETGQSNEIELAEGTYYVKEIAAPKGFQISEEIETFTVNAGEKTIIEVEDTPELFSLELVKYNEGFLNVLQGASFRLTNSEGFMEVGITDENGKIIWEGLQRGIYTLEEIESPNGYIRNRNVVKINIGDSEMVKIVSEVEKSYGNVIQEQNLIKVENKIGYKLPNTGSYLEIL